MKNNAVSSMRVCVALPQEARAEAASPSGTWNGEGKLEVSQQRGNCMLGCWTKPCGLSAAVTGYAAE